MILARISRAIREQNWFAVVLEFIIVIAGVVIGFQVTAWSEQRTLQAREDVYLELLRADVAQMHNRYDELVDLSLGLAEAMTRTLRALETCDVSLLEETDIERTFSEYQNTLMPQLLDATYNEMVTNGALAAMSDREMARAITNMFGEMETFLTTIPLIRGALPGIDRIVWERVPLSYDTSGRIIVREFDFDRLCQDLPLSNAVVEMIDQHHDWSNSAARVSERIATMEAALTQATQSAP